MAGMAKARGGMFSMCPKAAHMDTTAYGLHAAKKPMQTATLNLQEKAKKKKNSKEETSALGALHKTIYLKESLLLFNSFLIVNKSYEKTETTNSCVSQYFHTPPAPFVSIEKRNP